MKARVHGGSFAPILLPLGGGTLLAVISLSDFRAGPVLLPVVFTLTAVATFLLSLGKDASGSPAVFEIGFLYACAVGLYATYPLIGFMANGLQYTPLNDLRLFVASPSPNDLGRLGWMYVVHLVSFMLVYRSFRRKSMPETPHRVAIGRTEGLLLLLAFLAIQCYFLSLGRIYNWSFSTNLDRYVAFANLPQVVAQISGHLDGLLFTTELALLAYLFQRYEKTRIWIGLWLAAIAVKTVLERQSRTELVLLGLASLMMYQRWVRPLKARVLVVTAFTGLAAFNILGTRRFADESLAGSGSVQRLFMANEFETLLANAYDLDQRVRSHELTQLPSGFLAADVLALIPQQLLPFSKVTPANWYMRTYYPEADALGVGYCFGTVPEAIVAGGWPALVLRGGLLGLLLGFVQRAASRHEKSFWWMLFLVWASVLVYHSARNSTFTLIALFWYRFAPIVVAVNVAAWVLRAVLRPRPAQA